MFQTARVVYQNIDSDDELGMAERGMSELAIEHLEAKRLVRNSQAQHHLPARAPTVVSFPEFVDLKVQRLSEPTPASATVHDRSNKAEVIENVRLLGNTMSVVGAAGLIISSVWLGMSLTGASADQFASALTAQILAALFASLGYTLTRSVRHLIKDKAQGERRVHGQGIVYAATQ